LTLQIRAVLFDLGGVVVGSPLHVIAAYEAELRVPEGLVNRVVAGGGTNGAWCRLERGELDLEAFFPLFDAECLAAGGTLSAREMMMRIGAAIVPREEMLQAIRRLRERGLLVGAVTNNWRSPEEGTGTLRGHFDAFVESAVTGIRKPDPRIYRMACEALEIEPTEAVFLDDIGANLKAARELGMKTIKVVEPATALAELEAIIGFPLRD
jgi:putative hydrolase of the HAD superfamily